MNKFKLTFLIASFYVGGYAQMPIDSTILNKKAPDSFSILFKTTKGDFVAESKREWSPIAIDRLYQLIYSGFYNNTAIFRVQKGYVAQFGISDDPNSNNFWDTNKVTDEPVILKNAKGTIHFAHGGPGERTHQLYINLENNSKLDTIIYQDVKGFPGVAVITSGIEVIDSFYSEYGFNPSAEQDSIYSTGSTYLKEHYPELDYILKAEIIREE